eukprot:15077_1
MSSHAIFLFALSVASTVNAIVDIITIRTDLGEITGNVKTTAHAPTKVYEFLGIQYGNSPVGSLRFRPSTLNTSWNTSYDATTYGPMCIQVLQTNNAISEDCLYLNIWTQNIGKTQLLPVMLWIHGGSMEFGSGSDPSYDGVNFVGNGKDIVLVTINYRLGLLGWLQSQQLYDEDPNWKSYGGLNGLYDQINAIKWVKQFIKNFGGDPNQITIFGESAGGLSTCMLLISPMVPTGIFQRAIIESGSCTGPWGPAPLQLGLTTCANTLKEHKLSTNIDELRKLPATDFKIAARCAAVDGLILDALPSEIYGNLNDKNVVFNANEVIMGFNSMDGIIGYPWHGGSTPTTPAQYSQYLNAYISNKTQVHLIETIYYPLTDFPAYDGHSNASLAWESINGDLCVACPTMAQMQEIVQQKETDTNFKGFVYEFRGPSPHYAPHASEIPFIYDHKSNTTFYSVPWNQTLSDYMVSSWSNYGKYGLPNVTIADNNFEWETFSNKQQNVIVWDDNIRIETNYPDTYRHGACSFWYNEVGYATTVTICSDSKNV